MSSDSMRHVERRQSLGQRQFGVDERGKEHLNFIARRSRRRRSPSDWHRCRNGNAKESSSVQERNHRACGRKMPPRRGCVPRPSDGSGWPQAG
jgi:hypothetical protein